MITMETYLLNQVNYYVVDYNYRIITILALEGASRPSSKLVVNMFSLCTS